MEGRNHSSAAFSSAGSVSRMKADFISCSRDLLATFQPRAAIRDRKEEKKPPHVGLIGAGLAGLRCAEVLIDRGVRVTILEARDRIGGRIHQSKLLNQVVDMGPNWIHGTEDNPVLQISQEVGVSLCAVDDTMQIFEPNGTSMPKALADEELETVWSLIGEAFKYSNEECLDIRSDLSLKDFFKKKLSASSLSHDQQARVLLLAEMWGSFIGDSWERQSLRWFWLEECLEGENLYVMESHGPIVQHVAATALEHADIHLSTRVRSIENLRSDMEDPVVLVRTDDAVFEFDEVVVAVPLGCLKKEHITFVPPLPQRLQTAVGNASYSSLEKVYITFPVAFWDHIQAPSNVPDSNQCSTVEGSEAQREKTGITSPSFFHFLHPEYVPEKQQHWSIELVPLSSPAVFGSHAKPTVLIYTHDPCAAYVSSLIRDLDPAGTEYFDALDCFFRPFYSRLPNYQTGHGDCTPAAILATDWHGDDLAGNGSYSNFQVSEAVTVTARDGGMYEEGQEKQESREIHLDLDIKVMRSGLPERGVWFAGEHTAPFVALGTTTGAYWSGESAASRILAANGIMSGAGATPSDDTS
ncbi:flavin containing amine oxidase [Colletotrichum tabaci]|uniref:Flavin containing amine oxidase n=1 Tax=Colletotrichum tabaci TaxID=1209068 RepID=A0AAV9STM1_9PEZI